MTPGPLDFTCLLYARHRGNVKRKAPLSAYYVLDFRFFSLVRYRSMIVGTSDAAKKLNLSPRRTRELIQAGRLPAKKLGREWYLDTKDIRRFRRRPPGRPKKRKGEPCPKIRE